MEHPRFLEPDTRKTRYIVMDCDGTIIDRMDIFAEIFTDIVCKETPVERDYVREYYLSTAGSTLSEQFKGCLEQTGWEFRPQIEAWVRMFFQRTRTHPAPLFEGAKEVIRDLKANGFGLCAISGSHTGELKLVFQEHGLVFDMVMGSDRFPKGSEHIKRFAKKFGVSIEEFCKHAVYVGDGPWDMILANNHGMTAVGITTTVSQERLYDSGAEFIIETISQLPTLLSSVYFGE